MTSSPKPRITRRTVTIAVCLSLILNLIGIWVFFFIVFPKVRHEKFTLGSLQERVSQIEIERQIHVVQPKPAAASRPAHEDLPTTIAPHPHPVSTIAPSPAKPRHEIAHIVHHAAVAEVPPAAVRSVLSVTPRHAKVIAAAPVPDAKPALSDHQIEQLGQQFSKTIAESRETLAGVQASSEQAPVTTVKHYTMHFNGIHAGMNPGDGNIYVVQHWKVGDENWYYVRYTYMYADGTYEADQVPWPVHYPMNDDPFARHDRRVPIQPPPAGFKPDRPLKPILQSFFSTPAAAD